MKKIQSIVFGPIGLIIYCIVYLVLAYFFGEDTSSISLTIGTVIAVVLYLVFNKKKK
jgi:hypothetical protein